MELAGKQVVIVGLGKSGVAAAQLCVARGAHVIGTDQLPREKLSDAARSIDVELRVGGHEGVPFDSCDLIVMSPGVTDLSAVLRAESQGVEVIGELELASRFLRAPIVAVGGTNGKSTTTTLIGHLFRGAGARVFVGGNLGTPLSEAVDREWDVLVVEVSSFQLEHSRNFQPKISVLLNITEDHLDRYTSFGAYSDAKGRAFANQVETDTAIVPSDDAECQRQAQRGRGRRVTFGKTGDYVVEGTAIIERATSVCFSLAAARLNGFYNQLNAAAAVAAARAFRITPDAVQRGMASFEPLPHRMALVGELDSIRFYDDSKGTNVGASVTALLGLSEARAVLIAGGRDKQGSYEPLVRALERKGRALVLIGEAAPRIAEAVANRLPTERADSIAEAVATAWRMAHPGDAVLLSPACSSFDMFASYAERGDRFAAAVHALIDAECARRPA